MSRFVGAKGSDIYVVSDTNFSNDNLEIIEVSENLLEISSNELINNFKIKSGKIVLKTERKPSSDLKIALVTNWKMRCGISTYSEFLSSEIYPLVKELKLFIEDTDHIKSNHIIPDDSTITCWKRGESPANLISKLKEYDPDIIWFQHEFGLWPNARYWISMMNQLSDFRIIVTMHSVFHHKDKTIVEASIPEIIVHLDGAKKLLQNEKGINSKIHLIPHGSFPCESKEKLWNFYKSDHTFIQAGFGFEYKGYENSIKAVALLKEKYPDVFFTGLFSESPYNKLGHQIYYKKLMYIVKELNIEENIGIIRGFQSDEVLNSFLRTNKIAVFPYISDPNHEVFGASGAARLAMSKNIPIITSSIPHFSDIPSIKADSPEEIARELDKLFSSKEEIYKQLSIQDTYISNTSWANVAWKHIEVFEGNDERR